MINEITDRTEFEKALKDSNPVLVDFYAKWCTPCKMQAPILSEFDKTLGDKVSILKTDVDENGDTTDKYCVTTIPTLILFVGGVEKERRVGLTTKAQISDMLIKYI